ncbi:MAG: DUF5723 family protein [Cyclobacteriaceae bacterium]
MPLLKFIKPIFFVLIIISGTVGLSQNYLGFSRSRFAGVLGVEVNPASILNDTYKSDWLFPVAFDSKGSNNFSYSKKEKRLGFGSISDETFYKSRKTGRMDASVQINGPAVMFRLKEDYGALAISTRIRTYANAKINKNVIDAATENSEFGSVFEFLSKGYEIDFTAMSWQEVGLTYSRKVWEDKYSTLKVGATAKLLRGMAGVHADINTDELKVNLPAIGITSDEAASIEDYIENASEEEIEALLQEIKNDSTATINGNEIDLKSDFSNLNMSFLFDVSGNIDYSNNMDNATVANTLTSSFWGLGLDIGAVFEFNNKPKGYLAFLEKRIHKSVHKNRIEPSYKWKIGASIVDIGSIKFDRGKSTYSSKGGKEHLIPLNEDNLEQELDELIGDFGDFTSNPEQNLDSVTQYNDVSLTSGTFTIGLPTTLNLDVDYYWKNGFYINLSSWVSLAALKFSDYTVRNVSSLTVTPRYERDALGIYLPMSINYMGQADVGFAFRAGPLLLGVRDIGIALYNKKVNRSGIYFAFAKGFAIKKKADRNKSMHYQKELKRYTRQR